MNRRNIREKLETELEEDSVLFLSAVGKFNRLNEELEKSLKKIKEIEEQKVKIINESKDNSEFKKIIFDNFNKDSHIEFNVQTVEYKILLDSLSEKFEEKLSVVIDKVLNSDKERLDSTKSVFEAIEIKNNKRIKEMEKEIGDSLSILDDIVDSFKEQKQNFYEREREFFEMGENLSVLTKYLSDFNSVYKKEFSYFIKNRNEILLEIQRKKEKDKQNKQTNNKSKNVKSLNKVNSGNGSLIDIKSIVSKLGNC